MGANNRSIFVKGTKRACSDPGSDKIAYVTNEGVLRCVDNLVLGEWERFHHTNSFGADEFWLKRPWDAGSHNQVLASIIIAIS